jgi:hypothetical protein
LNVSVTQWKGIRLMFCTDPSVSPYWHDGNDTMGKPEEGEGG